MTNVSGHALSGSTQASQSLAHHHIDLASICLRRHGVGRGEPSLFAQDLVEAVDLGTITVEDLHEGSLGTGGSHGTAKLEILENTGDVAKIHEQLLDPLGGALAHGDGLSGLEVGEAQGGEVLVLEGELAQIGNRLCQLRKDELQAFLHEYELSIVRHKARGGTIVTIREISIHVSHCRKSGCDSCVSI